MLAALSATFLQAAPNSNTQLANNVPPWLSKAQKTGPADGNRRVLVSVYLKLQNESALTDLIRNLYKPGSAQYHKFLTPAQFRSLYSPAASDQAAVKSLLGQKGLKVEYAPSNGAYVAASGTVSQIASAFAVDQNQYTYRGNSLRANSIAPSIPSALANVVTYIAGLDESQTLIHPYISNGDPKSGPGLGYATPAPCSTYWGDHAATISPAAYQYGSKFPWVPCGYVPAQVRAAYGVQNVTQTGRGVRVGITDAFASPTIVDDVNRFSANYGLPLLTSANFQQVVVPGTLNFPENRFDPAGWYGEESLDIEWVHAIAPEATIVYAGSQNSNQPLDHALIHLIDNGLADIITNSWGVYGDLLPFGHVQADERAFMQAAAQGISVLFSSGDDGDVAAIIGIANGSWPATSPYVTGVGGTSLLLKNAAGTKEEYGWGTYTSNLADSILSNTGDFVSATSLTWPPEYLYGSGGGPSLRFTQPFYQQGVVPNSLATSTVDAAGNPIPLSTAVRVVPDVAMLADPNTGALYGQTYDVSGDALIDAGCTPLPNKREYCERRVGGTSLASPLFAGVLALVNQSRMDAGKSVIGFANPALYANAGSGLKDVLAPSSPLGMLRNFGDSTGITTRFRTINSTVVSTTGPVIEGANSSLRTTRGYDNVTGLGTANVPALIPALTQLP